MRNRRRRPLHRRLGPRTAGVLQQRSHPDASATLRPVKAPLAPARWENHPLAPTQTLLIAPIMLTGLACGSGAEDSASRRAPRSTLPQTPPPGLGEGLPGTWEYSAAVLGLGLGTWLFVREPARAERQLEIARALSPTGVVRFSYDTIANRPEVIDALLRDSP